MIPKKFFRYVIKGIYYHCGRNQHGCTIDELIAFVYLKNNRLNTIEFIEEMVRQVTASLCSQTLLNQSSNGSFTLNQLLSSEPSANSDASSSCISTTPSSPIVSDSSRTQSHDADISKLDKDENFRLDPNKRKPSNVDRSSTSSGEGESPPKALHKRKGKYTALPKHRKHK
ncbi:uncharacterized protein LOC131683954 [Topomyia yanbarensis]|uniref:uncharacterized protein LOC131683954 n=1 Tax=Topomyia yanbarensis TaxID=2498891 RepID=UPI00273CCAEC|nr:uncharacterized protein LOC131683954 [Topomyia yanbarensis]